MLLSLSCLPEHMHPASIWAVNKNKAAEKTTHYFTVIVPFIEEEHALEQDPSVLGLLLSFVWTLWHLLFMVYVPAHFTNHFASINLLGKYLLMPFLCQSLSKAAFK